jgi:hypothetical protein
MMLDLLPLFVVSAAVKDCWQCYTAVRSTMRTLQEKAWQQGKNAYPAALDGNNAAEQKAYADKERNRLDKFLPFLKEVQLIAQEKRVRSAITLVQVASAPIS